MSVRWLSPNPTNKLRLVWDRSPLYKMPPPVTIEAETSFASHVTPTQKQNVKFLDVNIQAPNFETTLMDGSLHMRMMPSYQDASQIKFNLSNSKVQTKFLSSILQCTLSLWCHFQHTNKEKMLVTQTNKPKINFLTHNGILLIVKKLTFMRREILGLSHSLTYSFLI